MSLTNMVRMEIPHVLREADKRLSEAELLEKLIVKIPDLKKNGKVRTGILRGVLNKLDNIPVEDLEIERDGGRVFYTLKRRIGWNQLVDQFLQGIEENNILKLDFTKNVTDEEIEFVRSASSIISELKKIKEVE